MIETTEQDVSLTRRPELADVSEPPAPTDPERVEIMILGRIAEAKAAVERCRKMPELVEMKAEAKALEVLAKQRKASQEIQNEAAELTIRVRRRIGEVLKVLPKNTGAAKRAQDLGAEGAPPTLEDLGIQKDEASRCQRMAALDAEKFEAYLAETKQAGGDVTATDVLKLAKHEGNRVMYSTDSVEWYTPEEIVQIARETMGSIDLDPATCVLANEVIQAETIYTKEDDGLSKEWSGNVWLNCPYGKTDGQSNQAVWTKRLIDDYRAGKVPQATTITAAQIGGPWFQTFWRLVADGLGAICFCERRVQFYNENGVQKSPPPPGSVVVYMGPNREQFAELAKVLGVVVMDVVIR